MKNGLGVALLLAALGTLGGCMFHYPVNERLLENGTIVSGGGYRFEKLDLGPDNSDSLFVCVAFSGGGMRAAAMAYGAIEKLATIELTWEGKRRKLIDEIDVVSSVSGGSFTAAYWILFGKDRLFAEFPEKFFSRKLDRELVLWGLCPWLGLGRILSPTFDRPDVASELYETIYGQHTFRVLPRRRPLLAMQATNLAAGDRFTFTQDEFDFLGSDLDSVTIARAVTASSAYPVLLGPIRLWNYPDPKPAKFPRSIEEALVDEWDAEGNPGRLASQLNRRRWLWAQTRKAYVEEPEEHPYVHLIDGGVSDNLGVGFIAEEYRSGFIRDRIKAGKIKKLVVIVVNAHNRAPEKIGKDPTTPTAYEVLMSTTSVGVDATSLELAEGLRELLEETRARKDAAGTEPYFIEIHLDDLVPASRRRELSETPTNYSVEPERVKDLAAASGELLETHSELRRLLADVKRGK